MSRFWDHRSFAHIGFLLGVGSSLVVGLGACSDEDVKPRRDAGGDARVEDSSADSPTQKDVSNDTTTADSSIQEAAADSASGADALAGDGGGSTPDAAADGPALDAAADAAADGRADAADAADASQADRDELDAGQADALRVDADQTVGDTGALDVPLRMCGLLDAHWGIATDAAACETATTPECPDRSSTWAADITDHFGMGPINTDCRINAMLPLAMTWPNDLYAWTKAFFGCPGSDYPGALQFGLMAVDPGTHSFTTADLALLSDLYLQAVDAALATPFYAQGQGPLPPLTTDQRNQIAASLADLAGKVQNTQNSNTYSFDSCEPAVPDAGND